MDKEVNVLNFYVMCNRLKDVVRTGWKDWKVARNRVESIAEHVYGVQMLAIAMWSEYKYDLDISKVITMLAVHEVEEIIIGDLTMFQTSKEKKTEIGHKAVAEVFKNLINANKIRDLIFEFDERKTIEAKFAYFCDKLECDLQCKLYDEENCVDVKKQEGNLTAEDEEVKKFLNSGLSWSGMWMEFGRKRYNYDKNFENVSKYAQNNKIK